MKVKFYVFKILIMQLILLLIQTLNYFYLNFENLHHDLKNKVLNNLENY